LSRNREIIYK